MKKHILTITLTFLGLTSLAQADIGGFQKSDVVLTGSLGFSSYSAGDFNASTFNLSPTIGYFISENNALGVGLIVSQIKSDNGTDISQVGAEVGLIHYFKPENQFSLFIGSGVAYIASDLDTFRIRIFPGLSYFVNDSFALNASVGNLSYSHLKDGDFNANEFGFNFNLSNVLFGVSYKF